MRTFSNLVFFSVISAGALSAATYTVNFDSPAYASAPGADPGFAGKDGWSQSASNLAPSPTPADYRPYAWIGSSFSSGNAAVYGGVYEELPISFSVSRQFSGLVAGKSLSFQNHITDSTKQWEGRDTFGFTVTDGGGDLLLTVNLVPASNGLVETSPGSGVYENGLWNIYYAFGADSLTATGNAIQSTAVNFFGVDFGQSGITFKYGNGNSAQHSVSGTATGFDVNDGTLNLNYTYSRQGNGNNHIRIDNIVVVDGIPEPSVAALAGIGALALLRRRRAH